MLSVLLKTTLFVAFAILVRGTLPRYRVDQLITVNWKYILFILIFFFIQILLLNLFLI